MASSHSGNNAMKILYCALALLFIATNSANAAEKWGLPNEKIVRFETKVVDILCELTGDCPQACGEGKRQLGLINEQGKLILPLKNSVIFAGTTAELIEFCGATVIADGLITTNRGYSVMALQFVKRVPDGKWQRTNRFLPNWAKQNGVDPKSKQAQRWFENDPRINALLAKDGKLGLGLAADREFLAKQ
jgi:hypothetical protein